MEACEQAVKSACAFDGVAVVIAKRPCTIKIKINETPYVVTDCKKCGNCMKLGCPAILKNPDKTVKIRAEQCVGCGLCKDMCKFGAIAKNEVK